MVDQGKAEETDKSVTIWNFASVVPPPIPPQVAVAPILPSSSSAAAAASTPLGFTPYPPALARYEDVVVNPKLFMDTLQKLHGDMATKFMVPIIGGRDLDLHKLFVEVTTRGGVERILREKKWKEVTSTFNFPSTATNASFILRKHYFSLLHHYEQIYYFKALGWSPIPHASWQSGYAIPIAIHGGVNSAPMLSPPPSLHPQLIRPAESVPPGTPPSAQVTGIIDGKFDGGYLVTVTYGSQHLKGVLYHSALPMSPPTGQSPQQQNPLIQPTQVNNTVASSEIPPVKKLRRRRRKKSEIKRRDPAHPKPNRSGYNFFFAEQHPKLKPLYHGRDREISRIIGELWTNIKEDEKAVYQEKAVIDKERYIKEMEVYRERQRLGQVISNAVPINQMLPTSDAGMVDAQVKEVPESETFEDEEEDDEEGEEEEDDECSMSMSEYDEDVEEPRLEDLNAETSQKDEPVIQSSAVKEAAEAALLLSKSNQEQKQEQEPDLSAAVSEDQKEKEKEKDSTA